MIEEYTIKGRSVDAEDTRAGGIADKIVEGFVIEMQCTMNTQNMVYDWLVWMKPLTLIRTQPCEIDARAN